MKFVILAALPILATASSLTLESRNVLARRQAEEACPRGYCTENGGTTGGAGAAVLTVTDVDSLLEGAQGEEPAIIIVSGNISGSAKIRVGSNKTIFGEAGSSIEGVGFYLRESKNVIMRNLKISKVPAANGDAIGLERAANVWVDHCDLSGDLNTGKDDYDGLFDVAKGSDWVTISYSYLHNHWKGSLIGSSDNNADTDEGKLHVTYDSNHFQDIFSRGPLVRFGTVHIVNNFYENMIDSGINTRMSAQVFVQSTAFVNSAERAVFSDRSAELGYAVLEDVALGGSENSAPEGNLSAGSFPYATIPVLGSAQVAAIVPGLAGQKL